MKLSPWHLHPGVQTGTDLSLGERSADRLRNIMGSWPFVFGFLLTMGVWAITNTVLIGKVAHGKPFDPYPYILLNLFLSMLAGLQGAILLIAAKRADGIAAQQALHHLEVTENIAIVLDENTDLTKAVKTNTDLLEEIHRHVSGEPGLFPPTPEACPTCGHVPGTGKTQALLEAGNRVLAALDDTVSDKEWEDAWEAFVTVLKGAP